jgi:hypothetical protein
MTSHVCLLFQFVYFSQEEESRLQMEISLITEKLEQAVVPQLGASSRQTEFIFTKLKKMTTNIAFLQATLL